MKPGNPHEVRLGKFLRSLERPMDEVSGSAYLVRRSDKAVIRKSKPPRRKKDRIAARKKEK